MPTRTNARPRPTLSLLTSTVKLDDEDASSQLRFCFRLVSPDGLMALQARARRAAAGRVSPLRGVCTGRPPGTPH